MHALLRMLLVCIRIYPKSVPRYKCLMLDTNHPDTICAWEGCEDTWLFFRNREGPASQMFVNHCCKAWLLSCKSVPAYGTRPHNFRNTQPRVLIDALRNSLVVGHLDELGVQPAVCALLSFAVHCTCIWFFCRFFLYQIISALGMSC
jgi:hypothetical protein